ncbi:rCG58207 [Rattus norvegicus]|uniref:RCG58207 n=1 Tax=Rattus norvegicus TaxID=10116 RepID=A6J4J0_RAT|nr:rCG58207 [Rattus norvegicus]
MCSLSGEPLRLSCGAKSKVLEVTVPEKQAAASSCWGCDEALGLHQSSASAWTVSFRLSPDGKS